LSYSKDIELDPNYSTGDKELVYAKARYRIGMDDTFYDGVLVIDVAGDSFLGILKDLWILKDTDIYGITRNGYEIILDNGQRYSTESHSYTGITLPTAGGREYNKSHCD